MHDQCLLVFMKAPVPGKVKTRLAATVGEERATELYIEMSRSVYATVKDISSVFVAIAYASHARYPDLVWLDRNDPGYLEQRGEDLGQRLIHAFDWAARSGAKRICAIGVDSPGLKPEWIEEAFQVLRTRDLVLGPVEDGGYYLIGMNRLYRELFEPIDWSSPKVFEQTVEAAKRLKLDLHEIPGYFDVDDEASLQRWLDSARVSSRWSIASKDAPSKSAEADSSSETETKSSGDPSAKPSASSSR